ncbi:MAG: SDR family oxidoreductase [Actinomycetota bacterium]
MRRAVITGAGRGLGRAIAERLAGDGLEIVALDVDGEAARATASACGGTSIEVDVRDLEAVEAAAASIGAVDVLINNAGIWHKLSLASSSPDQLRDVVDVNVMGVVHCTRAFAARLAAGDQPCIVNLSSGAAASSSPNLGTYPATKAAVESLTRQWALELAPVRVNAVGPGMIVTEGTAENYEGRAGELRALAVPLGRVGEPGDVADVVGFLVGPDARYVSGQVLYVDGGLSAGMLGR